MGDNLQPLLVPVQVSSDIKDDLQAVIQSQRNALNGIVTAKQVLLFQKTINQAMKLNGDAFDNIQITTAHVGSYIKILNPIEPLIEEAIELQNQLISKLGV